MADFQVYEDKENRVQGAGAKATAKRTAGAAARTVFGNLSSGSNTQQSWNHRVQPSRNAKKVLCLTSLSI